MKPQKQTGRPREFDPHAALEAATSVFWRHGYSGATIDGLADAMNMSKPSVYGSFGPKPEIYRLALEVFCTGLVAAITEYHAREQPLREKLEGLFEREIDFYCQNDPPRGCLLVCTAPVETANCPEVMEKLAEVIDDIDTAFAGLLRIARSNGELPAEFDTRSVAMCLQAILQTLGIRARAGASPQSLKRFSAGAIRAILNS